MAISPTLSIHIYASVCVMCSLLQSNRSRPTLQSTHHLNNTLLSNPTLPPQCLSQKAPSFSPYTPSAQTRLPGTTIIPFPSPLNHQLTTPPQRLPPTPTHSRTRTPRQPPIRLPLAATPSLRHPPNLRRAFAPGLHPTAHHAQPGGSEEATLALRRQGQNEVLHGAVDRAAGCDGVFSCCLEVGRWAEGGWGSGG